MVMAVILYTVENTGEYTQQCLYRLFNLSIMIFCLQRKARDYFNWHLVRFADPTSIGIWILHPLVLTFLRKLLEYAGIGLTLPLRVLMVPMVFVGYMIISKVALKIKRARTLFQI